MPRLLISVRNALEAAAAREGGCEILDVKEPARGSLGFAGARTIAEVVAAADGSGIPVSAALGETVEWLSAPGPPALPQGLAFVKLGLSRLGERADWRSDWLRVRETWDRRQSSPARWIAVAYADWPIAGAPAPDDVVAAAIETGCAGVLFDTWDKSRGRLTELVDVERLALWSRRLHDAHCLIALAGRLDRSDLSQLRPASPDVIAVRSVVCRDGDRAAPIAVDAVRILHATIDRAYASTSPRHV